MSGKFISLIIAASVAVTGLTAAPAQASDRDLARALAAIAGVAVIGAVIHESNKKKKRKKEAAQRQHYNNHGYNTHRPHRAKPKAKPHRPHAAAPRKRHKSHGNRHIDRRVQPPRHGNQHRYNPRPHAYRR